MRLTVQLSIVEISTRRLVRIDFLKKIETDTGITYERNLLVQTEYVDESDVLVVYSESGDITQFPVSGYKDAVLAVNQRGNLYYVVDVITPGE